MNDMSSSGVPKRVFVRAPIHGDAVALLRSDPRVQVTTWDDPQVDAWETEADAVIVRGLEVTADEILRAKRLKVIGRHGAGVDSVAVDAAREKGIIVLNTPFENTQSVAELTVTLMMASARRLFASSELACTGRWAEGRKGTGCRELFQNTVGFVGFGRIARMTARILTSAFDMRVLAYDPKLPAATWQALQGDVTPVENLETLFANSDFVNVSLPKTNETSGLVSRAAMAASRPGLILVNTARGGIVDEAALFDLMSHGVIGAAAFDVFEQEPPDGDNPLLKLPNFIATPHYGGATQESLERVAKTIAKETVAALFGMETATHRVV
ncbi:hydroxyacid dehydrogenase [Labrenzia sp. OB1]|uniref:hydroxyacid dehydrogenase n=1 Tax=Labrenzia sp. OB1 TaxID=1561204 RepID=UPI000AF80409|nr:hydroxyacid dehydrogenase [Labrenzia sp. OB1]